MRFLADENLPRASIGRLRAAGHVVASVREDDPGCSDEEILRRAAREQSVLLTFDRDFGELIFRRRLPSPAGVVYFREAAPRPKEPAEQLADLFGTVSLEGMFTTVDRRHVRQRRLP